MFKEYEKKFALSKLTLCHKTPIAAKRKLQWRYTATTVQGCRNIFALYNAISFSCTKTYQCNTLSGLLVRTW